MMNNKGNCQYLFSFLLVVKIWNNLAKTTISQGQLSYSSSLSSYCYPKCHLTKESEEPPATDQHDSLNIKRKGKILRNYSAKTNKLHIAIEAMFCHSVSSQCRIKWDISQGRT
ncbi:unnamed protein product [Rangifer tarandus platyrhynchus]|uniref:Uncharacterized protein n=2 Tax=Rangifer tarandus platyrhynchus TaxID=3082113 RepID=A0AC59ZKL0_RANTA|nr:unnamed protein product [Rangifer tarandus platyrhynchus]